MEHGQLTSGKVQAFFSYLRREKAETEISEGFALGVSFVTLLATSASSW